MLNRAVNPLDGMIEILDQLTTKVICHPDRADALRAAVAGIPLVRIVESAHMPSVDTVYVFNPGVMV